MEMVITDTSVQSRTTIAFALCMLCYLLGGTVATLMSINLPVAIPELVGKTPAADELGLIGAYLNASFIFGWMFGGLTLGVVSDKIGRIKTLAFSAGHDRCIYFNDRFCSQLGKPFGLSFLHGFGRWRRFAHQHCLYFRNLERQYSPSGFGDFSRFISDWYCINGRFKRTLWQLATILLAWHYSYFVGIAYCTFIA